MKNRAIYYGMSLLMALMMALPVTAQQKSPEETKAHTDMVMKKEHRRERKRVDKAEKRAAKAEKRINDKPQYKHRRMRAKHSGEKSGGRG